MQETLHLSVFLRIYNIYFSRFLQKSGNFAPEFTNLNSLICISNGILTIIFLNGHPVRDIARAYGRILKVARTIADLLLLHQDMFISSTLAKMVNGWSKILKTKPKNKEDEKGSHFWNRKDFHNDNPSYEHMHKSICSKSLCYVWR